MRSQAWIVRPGVLGNGPPRGRWRVGSAIGNPIWSVRIARADVARFLLDEAAEPHHLRATVALAW